MHNTVQATGLHVAIKETQNHKRPGIAAFISGAILSVLLFMGIAGCLFLLFSPPGYLEILMPMGVATTILLYACWSYPKLRLPGFLILLIWIISWSVMLQDDMINGFNLVATQIGEVLGQNSGRIFPLFEVTVSADEHALSATLFLVPICLLLALLSSFLVFMSSAVLSLCIAALFGIGLTVLDTALISWPFSALILATLLIAATSRSARRDYYGRFSKGPLQVCLGCAVILTAFFLIFGGVSEQVGYRKPQPVSEAQKALERTAHQVRYGVNTHLGMPDGDFANLGPLDLHDETALEVTMESPESLWLRGFVGSEYTGEGWKAETTEALYAYKDIFYWLHESGFFGQTQLADASLASGVIDSDDATAITVNNLGASSGNVYAPYETYWANDELLRLDAIGDTNLYSQGWMGSRQYSYATMPNQVKQFPAVVNSLYELTDVSDETAEDYLAVQGYYAQFAEEMYTQVDAEVETTLSELLQQSNTRMSFHEAKQLIMDVLTQEVSYSEELPLSLTSDDFITRFLSVARQGYSVHYASAGTMMFRYLGFPARYVEGYLITPADVNGVANNATLRIDGTHAHAWTEVYLDGVGWIPVELTPPYLGTMEQADTLQGVNAQGGQTGEDLTDEYEAEVEDSASADDSLGEVELSSLEFPWWLVVGGLIILLVVIIALAAFLVYRRRRILRERALLFESDDYTRSIVVLFQYCMDVLRILGLESNEIMRLHYLLPRVKHLAVVDSQGFLKAFGLYEEAVYSQHKMDSEKRNEVAQFKNLLVDILAERSRGYQGIRIKLMLCLL